MYCIDISELISITYILLLAFGLSCHLLNVRNWSSMAMGQQKLSINQPSVEVRMVTCYKTKMLFTLDENYYFT